MIKQTNNPFPNPPVIRTLDKPGQGSPVPQDHFDWNTAVVSTLPGVGMVTTAILPDCQPRGSKPVSKPLTVLGVASNLLGTGALLLVALKPSLLGPLAGAGLLVSGICGGVNGARCGNDIRW